MLFFFFLDFREIQNLGCTGAHHLLLQPLLYVCLCSVLSDFSRLYGLWPTWLLCPWDFLGKNTGMSCHFLLQGIFRTQGSDLGLLHCRQILYHLSHPLDVSFIEQSVKLVRVSWRRKEDLNTYVTHMPSRKRDWDEKRPRARVILSSVAHSCPTLCDPRLISKAEMRHGWS